VHDLRLSLRCQVATHEDLSLTQTELWRVHHNNGYQFYQETDVCDRNQRHKAEFVRFYAEEIDNVKMLPVSFPDESDKALAKSLPCELSVGFSFHVPTHFTPTR
jgi:hypothetical protein